MNKLKRHLSVANVLSCIALFVALGGTAFAAVKLGPGQVKAVNIANQAVTNPKLRTQAVTSGKIKNLGINAADLGTGSVINSKLAKKAVTNAKLGEESVGANKLAKKAVTEGKLGAESVVTGKLGNESVTGAKISSSLWLQLVKNVTYVNAESASDNVGAKSETAFCPNGKEAIGGGARVNGELEEVAITGSTPFVSGSQRTGWTALARELPNEPGAKKWSVEAFVVCAEL